MVEQSAISVKTKTGSDHWTKTAAEGARVECVLFAESMPCPGGNAPSPAVNTWLLCSLLWKSGAALDSRKRGSCARMFCRCGKTTSTKSRPSDIHIIHIKKG